VIRELGRNGFEMESTVWQFHSPWVGATGILVLVLDIAAGLWSWLRYRQLVRKIQNPRGAQGL